MVLVEVPYTAVSRRIVIARAAPLAAWSGAATITDVTVFSLMAWQGQCAQLHTAPVQPAVQTEVRVVAIYRVTHCVAAVVVRYVQVVGVHIYFNAGMHYIIVVRHVKIVLVKLSRHRGDAL